MTCSIFYRFCSGPSTILNSEKRCTGFDLLKATGCESRTEDFYIVSNGHKIDNEVNLEDGKSYHIVPRLLGGKGGFGSMLRAIGAQIEKTTSREACRDLSGRRMRDINNEKKLKEWLGKESEREKEKEDRRQERITRQLNSRHKFDDKEYVEQKAKVQEDLEAALSTGLKRANKKGETSSVPAKKPRSSRADWIGMDLDSDDLESDSDAEASPGNGSQSEEIVCEGGKLASSKEAKGSESDKGYSSENTDILTDTDSNQNSSDTSNSKSKKSLLSQLPPPTSDKHSQEKNNSSKSGDDASAKKEPEIDPKTPIDLELYINATELSHLGLERLKVALMTRGMKCGGTLGERAARLFCVKGIATEDIDQALLAKGKGKGKKSK